MVSDLMRDAPFGQAMRFLSRGRLFRYPEEMPDYVVPHKYLLRHDGDDHSSQSRPSQQTLAPEDQTTAGRSSVDAATLVNADQPVKRKYETLQEKQDRIDGYRSEKTRSPGQVEAGDESEERREKRQRERDEHPGTADPKRAHEEGLYDKYQYLVDFDEKDDPLNP